METPEAIAACGPKAFQSEVASPEVRRAINSSPALRWYRDALVGMAQREQAEMFAEIEHVGRENREIERCATNGFGLPYYRCPLSVRMRFEDLYGEGCWKDEAFVEDFLKHHPGLRVKVTRGTKGQEYRR